MEEFERLKAKRNIVGEIFIKNGFTTATEEQLFKVVGMADYLKPSGYSLEMVAELLTNEKNVKAIEAVGFDEFFTIATKARFPHIQAKKFKPNRNGTCPCGSGLKFKKCCILKTQ